MRWERLCALGRELPDVAEGTWYRTPGLSVRGRFFVRLKEDGHSVVFRLESVDEQELLTASRPRTYYITDHYRGYPAVLARLSALSAAECRKRLKLGWRAVAPRSLLRRLEAELALKRARRG